MACVFSWHFEGFWEIWCQRCCHVQEIRSRCVRFCRECGQHMLWQAYHMLTCILFLEKCCTPKIRGPPYFRKIQPMNKGGPPYLWGPLIFKKPGIRFCFRLHYGNYLRALWPVAGQGDRAGRGIDFLERAGGGVHMIGWCQLSAAKNPAHYSPCLTMELNGCVK